MLVGYISDEYFVAVSNVSIEAPAIAAPNFM